MHVGTLTAITRRDINCADMGTTPAAVPTGLLMSPPDLYELSRPPPLPSCKRRHQNVPCACTRDAMATVVPSAGCEAHVQTFPSPHPNSHPPARHPNGHDDYSTGEIY